MENQLVIVSKKEKEFLGKLTSIVKDSCIVFSSGALGKWINDEFVIKPSVQCVKKDGTTYTEWFESCDKELIDTRYYNLDGTRKS